LVEFQEDGAAMANTRLARCLRLLGIVKLSALNDAVEYLRSNL